MIHLFTVEENAELASSLRCDLDGQDEQVDGNEGIYQSKKTTIEVPDMGEHTKVVSLFYSPIYVDGQVAYKHLMEA